MSDDTSFTENIISSTKFSRYTINHSHTDLGYTEGWGGLWPSGYTGYKSWFEHFTDPYIIIE